MMIHIKGNRLQENSYKKQNEIRVFVSSTFQDLQGERDYLSRHVFPKLRKLSSDRGLVLIDVDLRWGITEEESEQGQVIRLCFDEIEKCRPYFIGILGNRYGWVPKPEDINKDQELVDKYKEVITVAMEEQISITEMEFLYRVLGQSDNYAFFYFKEEHASRDVPEEEDSKTKLRILKEKIRNSGYPVKEGFKNLEEFGSWVIEDFTRMLEEEYPKMGQLTDLEIERRMHENFGKTRHNIYIPNETYFEALDQFMESDSNKLILLGDSGVGKSALLANWCEHYRHHHQEVFMIPHFVGVVSSGYKVADVLRRFMEEIKLKFGIDKKIPEKAEEIRATFPTWLSYVQGQLVIVIDAVNQLNEKEGFLQWLPKHLPKQVKIIVSTTEREGLSNVKDLGWEKMEIFPLTRDQKKKLIKNYLLAFGKKLEKHQLNLLVEDEKCDSPIFLKTLLDELRIFGVFQQLEEKIKYYLSLQSIDELFQGVLERMENDYGKEAVRTFMSLIWASRKGLTETELLEIDDFTLLNRLNLSHILVTLDYHIINKDGVLDFFHAYLRKAVETRYFIDSIEIKNTHKRLANYFEKGQVTPRQMIELPYQLQLAGENNRLIQYISDPQFFLQVPPEQEFELISYWVYLMENGEELSPFHYYEDTLKKYRRKATNIELFTFIDKLSLFYMNMGRYDYTEELTRREIPICIESLGEEHPLVIKLLNHLSHCLNRMGKYKEAEGPTEKVVSLSKQAYGNDHRNTANSLMNLANLADSLGDYPRAQSLFSRVLEIQAQLLGPDHEETLLTKHQLGVSYRYTGDYTKAEPLLIQAFEGRLKRLGNSHPDTAIAMDSLGLLYVLTGNLPKAESLIKESLDICKKVLGHGHFRIGKNIGDLGRLRLAQGRLDEAENLLRSAMDNYGLTLGDSHPIYWYQMNFLGGVLYRKGLYAEAETLLRKTLARQEEIHGLGHLYSYSTLSYLGNILIDTGNTEEGSQILTKLIQYSEELLGVDNRFVEETRVHLERIQEGV